ncbi:hypothetical protein P7D58_21175, partial [Enterococcus avium]|uniref:hypothetical protein n=1 Tax=Enterococcus avium TaxID=33945 RepID=UPI00288CE752
RCLFAFIRKKVLATEGVTNTRYYRARLFRYVKGIGQTTPDTFFCVALACNRVNRSLSEIADVLFEIITYQKGWEYGGSSGVDA